MSEPARLVYFVTGCSSGIGRAIVQRAAADGHRVFASARRIDSIRDLVRVGSVEAIRLDVTKSDEILRAAEEVRVKAGRVDVLVNNAGYGSLGAVEDVALSRWRDEFDVNVFGLLEVTQAFLPGMRAAGRGWIVNIGSIAGLISYPFGGPYCASKYAVEAISDALRLELAPFGIRVILIEPGPIKTGFNARAEKEMESIRLRPDSPYHASYESAFTRFRRESTAGALPPESVAAVVARAVGSRRPRARYVITKPARAAAALKRLAPDSAVDAVMRWKFR